MSSRWAAPDTTLDVKAALAKCGDSCILHAACFSTQVELKTGEIYGGELAEAEDSWNVQLQNVTATAKVWSDVGGTVLQS